MILVVSTARFLPFFPSVRLQRDSCRVLQSGKRQSFTVMKERDGRKQGEFNAKGGLWLKGKSTENALMFVQ